MRTKDVILCDKVVTKHELGAEVDLASRRWPGAGAEETEWNVRERKGWPPSWAGRPALSGAGTGPGSVAAVRSPAATRPHKEIDEI